MADTKVPDVQTVEIVEEVLDNGMFLVAVAGGVVLGAILLYAFMEYQRNQTRRPNLRSIKELMQPDPEDDRPDEVSGVPGYALGE